MRRMGSAPTFSLSHFGERVGVREGRRRSFAAFVPSPSHRFAAGSTRHSPIGRG
jgi:hypothetical protein